MSIYICMHKYMYVLYAVYHDAYNKREGHDFVCAVSYDM